MSTLTAPTVTVEVGFGGAGNNSYLLFDDATRGLFDTGTFAEGVFYTNVSADVISSSIDRGRSRPLEQFQPGRCSVVLDNTSGDYDPNNLSGPYVTGGLTQVLPMAPIRIRETIGGVNYTRFTGYVDQWVQNPRGVQTATTTVTATDGFKVLAAYDPGGASAPAGASEDTGARIGRILDLAGIPAGDRDLDVGDSTLQETTLEGTALAQCQDAAQSEQGYFYVAGDGKYTFRNRTSRYGDFAGWGLSAGSGQLQPSVCFSNDKNDVPTAIYESVTLAYDDLLIKNTVYATITGGTLQTAIDSASVGTYLTKAHNVSGLWLEHDVDASNWAQQILIASSEAEQRVDAVSFLPAVMWDEAAWQLVLGLEFGDLIQVNFTPVAGDVVQFIGFFDGFSESMSNGTDWAFTLRLTPTTAYGTPIVFYDSVFVGAREAFDSTSVFTY